MATTWNPSDKGTYITLSNGDLTCECNASGAEDSVRATESKSSGKWYWEIYVDNVASIVYTGLGTSSANLDARPGSDSHGYSYESRGYKRHAGGLVAYGNSYTTGDIIGVALDLTAGKVWFAKNNVWQASGDPAAGTNEAFSGISGTYFPMQGEQTLNDRSTIRSTGSSQAYSPPAGFNTFDTGSPVNLLDGKLSINSPTNLLDGKVNVKDETVDLLDGKVNIKDTTIDLLDGKVRVKDSTVNLLDGKVQVKDVDTDLLDGKVCIEGIGYNYLDGKVWVKELITGDVKLPFLDIQGNTGAVGNTKLPLLEVLGEASPGINAQGSATLPALKALGYVGARCDYDLPSLEVLGTAVVGIVASGEITLPALSIESQAFTDAIAEGDVELPMLRVHGTSIGGAICNGKITLPSLEVRATGKVGAVCVGEVTLPLLVIEGEGIHIPVGDGEVVLPLIQVYATANVLVDPRDGCHILEYARWR